MKKPTVTAKLHTAKEAQDRVQDVSAIDTPQTGKNKWSAVQRVRLPHKVGLPLGSGGCGDRIER